MNGIDRASHEHVATIAAVMRAIVPEAERRYPQDASRAGAYALVVLQDVAVAVGMAVQCQMPLARAVDLVQEAVPPRPMGHA